MPKQRLRYDVFVSYASEDKWRARMTVEILQSAGLRVFGDEYILPGDPWSMLIDNAITVCRHFFVLWCCDAAESDYVHKEIAAAKAHGKPVVAHRLCLYPVPECLSDRQWVDCIDYTHRCHHERAEPGRTSYHYYAFGGGEDRESAHNLGDDLLSDLIAEVYARRCVYPSSQQKLMWLFSFLVGGACITLAILRPFHTTLSTTVATVINVAIEGGKRCRVPFPSGCRFYPFLWFREYTGASYAKLNCGFWPASRAGFSQGDCPWYLKLTTPAS
jgi:hypothetical protein